MERCYMANRSTNGKLLNYEEYLTDNFEVERVRRVRVEATHSPLARSAHSELRFGNARTFGIQRCA